MIENMEETLT